MDNNDKIDRFHYQQELSGCQSNWPNLGSMKSRKIEFYAVDDVHGVTIYTSKKKEDAVKVGRALRRPVRPVLLEEEDLAKEDMARKDRMWLEQLYKPSPTRSLRRR
jgi:hypothetical protein